MGNLIDVPGIEVDLLWWQGCPSTDHALALVRGALDELGLNSVQIRMVEIETDEQARELGFRGSPTILINGVDVITLVGGTAINEDQIEALSCRVYRTRDGRVSPTPDPDDVRTALSSLLRGAPSAGTRELA
jgi:hypothetical protein